MTSIRDLLPKSLREIEGDRAIGAVVALIQTFGGQTVMIARRPRASSAIAKELGMENALIITEALGAGKFQVPRGVRLMRAECRRAVEELTRAGKSENQIAKTLSIAGCTVRRHRKELGLTMARQWQRRSRT